MVSGEQPNAERQVSVFPTLAFTYFDEFRPLQPTIMRRMMVGEIVIPLRTCQSKKQKAENLLYSLVGMPCSVNGKSGGYPHPAHQMRA